MQSVDGDVRLSVGLDTKSVRQNAADIGKTVTNSLNAIGTSKGADVASSKMMTLQANVEKAATKVLELKDKIDKLSETSAVSPEYKALENDLAQLEKEFDKLIDLQSNLFGEDVDIKGLGKNELTEFEKISNEVDELLAKIEDTKSKMQEMREAGTDKQVDSAQYEILSNKLHDAERQYDIATQKVREFNDTQRESGRMQDISSKFKKVASTVKSVMSKAGSYLKSFASVAKSAFNKAANLAKSAFKKITSHARNSSKNAGSAVNNMSTFFKKGLRTLLKYGLGVRSLYFLFRKFRKAVGDGIKNLVQYSDEVNKDVSALKSTLTKLKNSFATMFQPLIKLLTPALTALMNKAAQVATYIGKIVAVFAGQDYVYEAVDVQEDYAKSLNDTAKSANKAKKALEGYLSPLDDINRFQENQTDSDADEDTSAVDPSKMFKVTPIESKFKDLFKRIKDILKSPDWTELGSMLGKKLNNILGNIDWAGIQEKARTFAKRLYTLINGFVAEVDWTLVGKTIAEGIRTGLIFLVTFIEGLDWGAIGKAFGKVINALADPENAKLFARVLTGVISGGLTLLTSMLSTIDWAKVSDTIIAFISNFDFEKVSRIAVNLLNAIAKALGQIKFTEIGNAISNGISKIDWAGLWDGVVKIAAGAFKGIANLFGVKVDTSKFEKAFEKIKEPVDKLLNAFKSLLDEILPPIAENLLPAIANVLSGLMSAIAPILKSLTPVLTLIINVVSKILEALAPILPVIGEAIGKFIEMVTPIIDIILKLITKIVEKLAPVLGDIFEILGEIFEAASPFIEMIMETLDPVIDIIGGILEALGGVIKFLKGVFTGDWEEAWEGIKQIFSGIWNAIVGIVKSVWEAIKFIFKSAWEAIKQTFSYVGKFFSGIWSAITQAFKDTVQFFGNIFANAWQAIKKIWDTVAGFFKGIWDEIVGVFKGVGDWFGSIFQKAVSGIKNAFNGIKQWFSNLWQGIWNVIKTPINWIIDGINALIGGINSIQIDVPDWVPVIGGKKFGFDIPEIPHLATGAVIPPNKEFLAVLGDQKQGTNIEAPANLIRQIVREEMQNSSTGNKYEIPLVVGRQTLYKLIIDEAKLKMAQTGANPFDLITV